MGRNKNWFRKRHTHARKQKKKLLQPDENGIINKHIKVFNDEELLKIESYLSPFKKYHASPNTGSEGNNDDNCVDISDSKKIGTNHIIRIAEDHEIIFPILNFNSVSNAELEEDTDGLSSSSYIELPYTLTKGQRRQVHQICTFLSLHHGSINKEIDKEKQMLTCQTNVEHAEMPSLQVQSELRKATVRSCVIAKDENVLAKLLGYRNDDNIDATTSESKQSYRPWYYRRHTSSSTFSFDDHACQYVPKGVIEEKSFVEWREDIFVKLHERKMRKVVQNLIDNPELCHNHPKHLTNSFILSQRSTYDIDNIPFMLISNRDELKKCRKEILAYIKGENSKLREIGFDLEMYNRSKYEGQTCLLQISTIEKDFIIDTLSPGVWDCIHSTFADIFADPSIIKIGHSVGSMDVKSLHRDFGIVVVNVFDTFEVGRLLRLPKLGLVALCAHYDLGNDDEYAKLKGRYQMCDWKQRPLTSDMIRYGRYDVRYLFFLRRFLIQDILEKNSNYSKVEIKDDREIMTKSPESELYLNCAMKNFDLLRALSKSQNQCLRFWGHSKEKIDTKVQKTLMKAVKGKKWSANTSATLQNLLAWRQITAWNEEVMPASICSTEYIMSVALIEPRSEHDLRKIDYRFDHKYIKEIFHAISSEQETLKGVSLKDQLRVSLAFGLYVASSLVINYFSSSTK